MRINKLFSNALTYEPYQWNEALSRAGRHVLNDQGACSTSGDIYSLGFNQVLSAYYAWNYLGLEYKIYEGDHFVDWKDFENSPEKAFYFLLS